MLSKASYNKQLQNVRLHNVCRYSTSNFDRVWSYRCSKVNNDHQVNRSECEIVAWDMERDDYDIMGWEVPQGFGLVGFETIW